MFIRAVGRERHCRQMSLVCVGSTHSVPATLGLPRLMGVCFPRLHCSGSRLLYSERALSFVHFPGLSCSGSGFWVLHKDANSVGPAFCALPVLAAQGTRSLRSALSPRAVHLIPFAIPASVSACTRSGVACVSSGKLDSSCDPSGGCQPSRISGSL